MASIEELLKIIKKNNKKADLDMVRLAFDFAKEAHEGQKRKSGDPYISHPLETAIILAKMKLDLPTIIAAILHDVAEDTQYNLVDIKKNFGDEVEKLVAGITKLSIIKYRGDEKYAENLQKMFISMAEDIRVVLIKMADRLHNLKTLSALPEEKRERIAKEVLEIYAPIANRLGMSQLKGELEDLAFPYALPEEFAWFQREIIPKYQERLEFINNVINILKKEIKEEKIKLISIHGRAKHFYSLYQKLLRPQYNKDVDRIYDLVAVRMIVPTISDCYKILGIIHHMWKPLIGRIKDYIAQPKPNGYQSLHTTVFATGGKIVELQVRTPEMHEHAEYGIAAHWHYKEMDLKFFDRLKKGFSHKGYELPKKLQWVNELVKWQKEAEDSQTYIKTLKIDAFQNRIFVLTPKGDVIDLPEEATPIDFAYYIHTDIGNRCGGVKINGVMEKLDTKLRNGDVVEIIIDRTKKRPSPDWLRIAKTASAKSKIKQQLSLHNKTI